jgi:hypothetical protein
MNNLSEKPWRQAGDTCLLLFTSRNIDQLLRDGGSQAWVLNLQRARECRYVVCAWNPRGEYAQPNVNLRHGEAFLVAPISSIEPAAPPEPEGRYIVRFTEYAVPNESKLVWNGQRNPVAYSTLTQLGFDSKALAFARAASHHESAAKTSRPSLRGGEGDVVPLTIPLAKRGLALYYGVKPDAIEIIIRG